MPHNHQKKIAVINDFCGFGRCSLAASLPIISALKVQCCPLPTAVFSNHTGFPSRHMVDFTDHMNSYMDEWKKLDLKFSGILTGYLGSPEQIEIVKRFLSLFEGSDTVTVIDPVMGDAGSLYPTFSPVLAAKMAELLPHADILTPNLTEACFLTGTSYDPAMEAEAVEELCRKLSAMGPKKIVVSGFERGEDLENYIYIEGEPLHSVKVHKVGPFRSGTGDVFSSIIVADVVNGKDLVEAVNHAASFIAKVLHRVLELDLPRTDGLCFEECLTEINDF